MKTKLLTLLFVIASAWVMAQVPQSINYQAVARDISGNPIINTNIGVQFSVLQGSPSGTSVFTETHTAITNNLGLFNLAIGTGTPSTGTFPGIDWANFPYFLEVSIDPTGGTNYQLVGASEMHSVPYALRAPSDSRIEDKDGDTWIDVNQNAADPDEIHMSLGLSPGSSPGIAGQTLLVLRRNNTPGLANKSTMLEIFDAAGNNNLFIGENAGKGSTGADNTVVGYNAFQNNGNGNNNTAFGINAMYWNINGSDNTAIGHSALYFNGTGALGSNARHNTAIGAGVLYNNLDGRQNTAMGDNAMYENEFGSFNIGIGVNALRRNKANSRSTAIGYRVMFHADDRTTGRETYNTAVGYEALFGSGTPSMNTGQFNTAIGDQALWSNAIGSNNTATGVKALYSNMDGLENTAVGSEALKENINGSENTAVGSAASIFNTTGIQNTAMGMRTLFSNTTGSGNVAVGWGALFSNIDGFWNSAFGVNADVTASNLQNSTAIGANAKVATSNTMILGDNDVNVGIGLSGVTPGPTNKLEINATVPNASGLTFRQLTANSTPVTSPTFNNVLTVDANGKVILVPSGSGLVGYCNPNAPMLSSNAGVNLNGKNFYFEDGPAGINQNNVGIGLACNASFTAKLHVVSNQNVSGNNTGIFADVFGNNASNTGIYGIGSGGVGTGQNFGVHGRARGAINNYAIYGLSSDQNQNPSGNNYGVFGSAQAAPTNYGGFFSANGFGATNNYGIYARGANATTHYAGYFDGNVHVQGTLSKSGGSFKIDHPQDPANKYLQHSFVESPDMMNVYNGNITTDANGDATVQLPGYFEILNQEFRYQLTCIGQFAQAIVAEEIQHNSFKIKTDKPNVKVSWQVTGIRHDPWAEKNRLVPELEKSGNEKGLYLNPELYGKSENLQMHKPKHQQKKF